MICVYMYMYVYVLLFDRRSGQQSDPRSPEFTSRFHDSTILVALLLIFLFEEEGGYSRRLAPRGYDGRATMYEGVLKRARTRLELAALRGWFSSSAGYRLPCTQCHIVGTRGADTTPASTETLHGVAKPACHAERRCQGACHRSIRLWSRDIHWPRNSIGICGGGDLTDLSNSMFVVSCFWEIVIKDESSECLFVVDLDFG